MGTGGLSLGVGPLCGENSGQHLYLPVQGARLSSLNAITIIVRDAPRKKIGLKVPAHIWMFSKNLFWRVNATLMYLLNFASLFSSTSLPRGGPASLRIHTQARGAEFSQGYKWNIRVTQVFVIAITGQLWSGQSRGQWPLLVIFAISTVHVEHQEGTGCYHVVMNADQRLHIRIIR